jgi:hypothetical protein
MMEVGHTEMNCTGITLQGENQIRGCWDFEETFEEATSGYDWAAPSGIGTLWVNPSVAWYATYGCHADDTVLVRVEIDYELIEGGGNTRDIDTAHCNSPGK